ncbi:hypothetical protein KRX11_10400 [Pasteurellaceae bacterium TAE3-ERU1]|nr:hypothetical protein [Pasteurellaceae bacterium TAE3-ERU1]
MKKMLLLVGLLVPFIANASITLDELREFFTKCERLGDAQKIEECYEPKIKEVSNNWVYSKNVDELRDVTEYTAFRAPAKQVGDDILAGALSVVKKGHSYDVFIMRANCGERRADMKVLSRFSDERITPLNAYCLRSGILFSEEHQKELTDKIFSHEYVIFEFDTENGKEQRKYILKGLDKEFFEKK